MGSRGREALLYVNLLALHTSLMECKTFVVCKLDEIFEKASIFAPVLDRRPPPRASAQHQQNLSPGMLHSFCVFVCIKRKSSGNFTSDCWHFGFIGSLKRCLWSSWLFIIRLLLSFPLLTPPWRRSKYQNYQSHKWRSELLWQEVGGASNQPHSTFPEVTHDTFGHWNGVCLHITPCRQSHKGENDWWQTLQTNKHNW